MKQQVTPPDLGFVRELSAGTEQPFSPYPALAIQATRFQLSSIRI
jgi:hypothetical protein